MENKNGTKSLWQDTTIVPFYSLTQGLSTEVCIIGAGMAGLTTAYTLLKRGYKVVVLDKEKSIKMESALTSAHLSSALDDHYFNIIKKIGLKNAQLAAQSHTKAIDYIEEIIKEEKIDCDFKRVKGYLIPCRGDGSLLKKEFDAAAAVGLHVKIVSKIPKSKQYIGEALEFDSQAIFHPIKYLIGLQKAINKMGGKILGSALVSTTKESHEEITVNTSENISIKCQKLVFATNSPINHVVAMHTKEAAYRSYVIGVKVEKNSVPNVLIWDTDDPYHYVRIDSTNSEYDIAIIGGEDHRVGQGKDDANPFLCLKSWADVKLGVRGEIIYQWSGQIIETLDGLAYIGKSEHSDNVFEVSGDSGHGLTHGTIAGILIPDLISTDTHAWQKIYEPTRKPLSLKEYVVENVKGFSQNIDWITPGEVSSPDEIKKGEGAIVRKGCTKVAFYRDHEGTLHEYSAICPHLGALTRWNKIEKSWDCPFHGSRFSTDGEVINGPAVSCLTPHGKNKRR